MKHHKGLTILFGLIPGAGQMYLGLMKKGVFILVGLAVLNILSNILNIYLLSPLIPVIWIYSFFDTLHLSDLDIEERLFNERLFVERLEDLFHQDWHAFIEKYRTPLTVLAVVVGIELFYANILLPLRHIIPSFISWPFNIIYQLHGALYSLAFIVAGCYFFFHYRAQKN